MLSKKTKKGILNMIEYWNKHLSSGGNLSLQDYSHHYCKANRPYYKECRKTHFDCSLIVTKQMVKLFVQDKDTLFQKGFTDIEVKDGHTIQ